MPRITVETFYLTNPSFLSHFNFIHNYGNMRVAWIPRYLSMIIWRIISSLWRIHFPLARLGLAWPLCSFELDSMCICSFADEKKLIILFIFNLVTSGQSGYVICPPFQILNGNPVKTFKILIGSSSVSVFVIKWEVS